MPNKGYTGSLVLVDSQQRHGVTMGEVRRLPAVGTNPSDTPNGFVPIVVWFRPWTRHNGQASQDVGKR